MQRRKSFYDPIAPATRLADAIIKSADDYLTAFPEKSFFHNSHEDAKNLRTLARAFKNQLNSIGDGKSSQPMDTITYIKWITEFLDAFDKQCQEIRRNKKTTLENYLLNGGKLQEILQAVTVPLLRNDTNKQPDGENNKDPRKLTLREAVIEMRKALEMDPEKPSSSAAKLR